MDLPVHPLHDQHNTKHDKWRRWSVIGLSRNPSIDIHVINSEVKDHKSIEIPREYDPHNRQNTELPTARHLKHDAYPAQVTKIAWRNMTVVSGQIEGGGRRERFCWNFESKGQDCGTTSGAGAKITKQQYQRKGLKRIKASTKHMIKYVVPSKYTCRNCASL